MNINRMYETILDEIKEEVELEIAKREIYDNYLEIVYNDKLRDIELINDVKEVINRFTEIIKRINKYEEALIVLNETDLMLKYECQKAKLVNMMLYFNDKYML